MGELKADEVARVLGLISKDVKTGKYGIGDDVDFAALREDIEDALSASEEE
jgi:hypothetical protein